MKKFLKILGIVIIIGVFGYTIYFLIPEITNRTSGV